MAVTLDAEGKVVSKSLDELAAMMAANRKPDDDNVDNSPNEVINDGQEDDDQEDNEQNNDDVIDEDDNIVDDDDNDVDNDDDVDDNNTDDNQDYSDGDIDIDDDDLVEIEGLDEPVSFKDLKAAYTADTELPKRFHEAESVRSEAFKLRESSLNDSQQLRNAMQELVKYVDGIITQPLISKPSAELKQRNANQYIQHLEAYEKDQERIKNSRDGLIEALQEHSKSQEEIRNNHRVDTYKTLMNKFPDLQVIDRQEKVTSEIIAAADHFGFTQDEVRAAADPRILEMAYYANQYLKLKSGFGNMSKEDKEKQIRDKIQNGPKTLRSKGTTSKSVKSTSQRRVKVFKSQAQKTGKTDDVANYMTARRSANQR